MQYQKILIVCAGNICRSPIAEGLLKQSLPDHFIASAGIAALVDHPADDKAIRVAQVHGLDLSAHKAKQLTPQMCLFADLILVMEERQIDAVASIQPLARSKTMLLGQWTAVKNIPDPYQKHEGFFEDVYRQVSASCSTWAAKLKPI